MNKLELSVSGSSATFPGRRSFDCGCSVPVACGACTCRTNGKGIATHAVIVHVHLVSISPLQTGQIIYEAEEGRVLPAGLVQVPAQALQAVGS